MGFFSSKKNVVPNASQIVMHKRNTAEIRKPSVFCGWCTNAKITYYTYKRTFVLVKLSFPTVPSFWDAIKWHPHELISPMLWIIIRLAAILIRSLAHHLSSALRAAAATDRSGFAKYKSNIVYPWTNTYRTLLLHLHPQAKSNRDFLL